MPETAWSWDDWPELKLADDPSMRQVQLQFQLQFQRPGVAKVKVRLAQAGLLSEHPVQMLTTCLAAAAAQTGCFKVRLAARHGREWYAKAKAAPAECNTSDLRKLVNRRIPHRPPPANTNDPRN